MEILKSKELSSSSVIDDRTPYLKRLIRCISLNKSLYLMIIPVLVYYIIFCYMPMYGVIIAFKDFTPGMGILHSPWAGLKNFTEFFTGMYFSRVTKNTLVISITSIVFGFPAPIILALLLNELKNRIFKRVVQTITYIPHFISLVVVCGMILEFTSDAGIITYILHFFWFFR